MLNRELAEGVVTLTLANPARGNALSATLVEALLVEVARACHEPNAHTLLLRGQGKHFCTGLDLGDLASTTDGELLHRLVRIETLLALLWHAPLCTVAMASGRTWGAGADLMACCEVRVADVGTSFRFPGAQFGIVLGTRRLAERIGADGARRLALGGVELDAPAAMAAGLITAIGDGSNQPPWIPPACGITPAGAAALRAASRADHRDADLAALVRSAAEPGLRERIVSYRERGRAAGAPAPPPVNPEGASDAP